MFLPKCQFQGRVENGEDTMIWNKKKKNAPVPSPYPPESFEPVLRSSICTGEATACFRNRETGKLHEIMVINSPKDLTDFAKQYGVDIESMRTVY